MSSAAGRTTREAGFSLIAAVFLIVVLAALGLFAVRVAMSQYQGAEVELLEARAQAAAQAGIEYGANMALQQPTPSCASRSFVLTRGVLAGYAVTVTCSQTTHQIYSSISATFVPYTVYALTATATHGTYGRPDYVSRTVARNVTNAPP